ncbi:hypothetical protein SNE40_015681 [Patella caerulea]|uniref:Ubiquitin carboxyl-terminal hydrolase n=1 Tax=Patella caerulea TaxID=87958 RepID=A0AAN8JMP8_PATCE
MEVIKQNITKIKSPLGGEKVYKDECAYSFDNPESENGLYICMNTFLGLGKKHMERHYRKTGNQVFLNIKRRRIEVPKDDQPPEKKPTKLAIGVEGGFQVDDKSFKFEEETSIVVLPDWTVIPLPNRDLPDMVQLSAASILAAVDAWKMEEAAAMACTWEGEKLRVSKHADNLLQLDNGKKIPPKGWKCEQCDLTSNLWLNLTDGSILCGRKFFDGSGGNNHAVEAYQQTKYPLAVKLGTITASGGDVYSYEEDDMVEDPHLAKHLAHFGINISALEKTDKTMVELEIDLNQKIGEWDVIQESGNKLEPVYGAGLTGMRNLGNSCYMNSVMQVVFTIPDFQKRYYGKLEEIFGNASGHIPDDLNVQMAKLGHGLLSGEYSHPPKDSGDTIAPPPGIRPQMFKSLIGRGHPEFSTKRQQDAQEYFLHLINVIQKSSRGQESPTECFRFEVEERTQCSQSKNVQYKNREEFCLSLPVPLEAATNKEEAAAYEVKKKELQKEGKPIDPKDIIRPRISLNTCIEAFASPVTVEDFYSSAINGKTTANQQTRLSTFPDYLMVHLKKFTVNENWVPVKLDVSIDIPDILDISHLRGQGLQAGEEVLPEQESQPPPQIVIDEGMVNQLTEMGFDREGCRKAVYHKQSQGIEAAMNWVMEHMGDPDFSVPLQLPSSGGKSQAFVPNDEALSMIMAMGFNKDQATKALKATDNNIERAADWIFSHAAELDEPMETETPEAPQSKFRDGNGKYKLVGFISHMGTSTSVGHYVCHILKDGQWVIFNDEKVAKSVTPPKDLAYLYLYQRV